MTTNNRTEGKYRIEEDALGKVEVPADHLWGAQIERSHRKLPMQFDEWVRQTDMTHPLTPCI